MVTFSCSGTNPVQMERTKIESFKVDNYWADQKFKALSFQVQWSKRKWEIASSKPVVSLLLKRCSHVYKNQNRAKDVFMIPVNMLHSDSASICLQIIFSLSLISKRSPLPFLDQQFLTNIN